jgi:Flp pilus assembly protein TadB
MSAEKTIAVAFLCMSIISMAWQGTALRRLIHASSLRSRATQAYDGLLRTAVCRVATALAYVIVGINALWPRVEVLILTFAVFCATQAVWQLNAWADLRLARRLREMPRTAPQGDNPLTVPSIEES